MLRCGVTWGGARAQENEEETPSVDYNLSQRRTQHNTAVGTYKHHIRTTETLETKTRKRGSVWRESCKRQRNTGLCGTSAYTRQRTQCTSCVSERVDSQVVVCVRVFFFWSTAEQLTARSTRTQPADWILLMIDSDDSSNGLKIRHIALPREPSLSWSSWLDRVSELLADVSVSASFPIEPFPEWVSCQSCYSLWPYRWFFWMEIENSATQCTEKKQGELHETELKKSRSIINVTTFINVCVDPFRKEISGWIS